jgi:hypothetical protein
MRNFLVKNFVGYSILKLTWAQALSQVLLLPAALVTLFFGQYEVSVIALFITTLAFLFGLGKVKTWNTPRCSKYIYGIILYGGLLWSDQFSDEFNLVWFNYVYLVILALALFFGFLYFRIDPAKWEEMDEEQKYQYGKLIEEGLNSKGGLTVEQEKEYRKLKEFFEGNA